MKYVLLPYLFFLSFCAFSQNQQQIDSLKIATILKKMESVKIKTSDSILYYGNKIISYSNSKKYVQGTFIGYDLIASYYYNNQNYDKALINTEKSYEIAKKLQNEKFLAKAENLFAFIYFRLNDYKKSNLYSDKALKNGLSISDVEIISNAYLVKGNIHYMKFENDKALNYYHKIDSVASKKEDFNIALVKSLTNSGNLILRSYSVKDTSFISVGESYFKKARDVAKTLNNELEENYAIGQLGKIYGQRGNYEKSISYFLKSLSYFKKNNNVRELANTYWSLGIAYNMSGDFNMAKLYYQKRISLYKNTTNKLEYAKTLTDFAGLLYYNKKYAKAIPIYTLGLKMLDSLNYQSLGNMMAKNYELGQSLAKVGNYKEAYKYLDKAFVLQDSLNNKKQDNITLELEKKYQTEKKEQEIKLLKSQNELTEHQKIIQRNQLLGGIALTSIAGLFLFVMYRNRQKTNKKLKQLDTLKSNFFTNISHEFRTPLTLISGPIQEALDDKSLSDSKRSQFEMVQRNSQRLLALVDQLLELSKIDAGHLNLHIQKGNVLQLISGLCDSFSYSAEQKEINYHKDIKTNAIEAWLDRDITEKIVVNLLSNAIKYTPNKGSVVCNAFVTEGELHLQIKNTGKGLTPKEINTIFQRFYQTNEQNQGSGIGLALVKELVELHKGSIFVESDEDWTLFTVELPIEKYNFNSSQILNETIKNNKAEIPKNVKSKNSIKNEFIENEQPILLIIEDNQDLRVLLKQYFEPSYNVITASNGKIGIDLALTHIPDIIISDIMMPIKDGIVLTKELKNDERTSHIPIILLTAKADCQSHFKGVESGADDYIAKPFDKKILILKVKKLIESRKKLQERYSQEVILRPKEIAITSIDEIFLEKLQVVLDKELSNANFLVDDFASEMGMSRMQLHRKLKSLLGVSATEFLRIERIKMAGKLLKEEKINISEIAYLVGFNDLSYFNKCFKEIYHCTPSEYIMKNK